jgi:hypothetical protein
MSWTDVFPVLDDQMVSRYEKYASKEDRSQYEAWFGVQKIVNEQKRDHKVCFSLFWKNIHAEQGELPKPSRHLLKTALQRGISKRFDPWKHYVAPLLTAAKNYLPSHPTIGFRVYLAADLEFLVDELVKAGCEVFLMKSSSIRHNPGALWRYLALEEKDTLVTFLDSDRAREVHADVGRTEYMAKLKFGFWRVPWFSETPIWATSKQLSANPYRPILGCQFGSKTPIEARLLMEALHWNTANGHILPLLKLHGKISTQLVYGAVWPDYGYDEWFLLTAVYPRIAKAGVITFLPSNAGSPYIPLDIEYVTWANKRSEIIYF